MDLKRVKIPTTEKQRDPWTVTALVAAIGMVAALGIMGRLAPITTPDTPGYLDLGPFPDFLAKPRAPLYGWLVELVALGSDNFALVPSLQVAALIAGAWTLARAAIAYGMSRDAGLALFLAVVCSNTIVITGHAINPELPATAAMLFALSGTLRIAATRPRSTLLAGVGLACGAGYILRPSLLPFIFILPMIALVLAPARRVRAAALIFVASAFPFIGVASIRQATLGDFNVVSFGGFQLSGVAGLMLEPEIADRLPDGAAVLARQIIDTREATVAARKIPTFPLNASGRRAFNTVAVFDFDILDASHSELVGAISRLRSTDETWVAFNRRLQDLAIRVFLAAPDRYATWIIGATTRVAGHIIVENVPFLLSTVLLIIFYLFRRSTQKANGDESAEPASDVDALLRLVGLYVLGAGILSVLVTVPDPRYVDTAGILLPALPIYGLVRAVRHRRRYASHGAS